MDKIRVLLVEDEHTLAGIVKDALEANGFIVEMANDGISGLDLFFKMSPDILVADVMMPKMSGFDMVRKIRQNDKHTPVLFLTAKTSVDDVVDGFHAGGNDYLKKPFGMKELFVRIEALLGKINVEPESPKTEYMIGDYFFNPVYKRLKYVPTGESVELPNRENEILERLCVGKNSLVSAKEILMDLWGDDDFFCTRSFQVLISRLRQRFSKDSRIKIMNVRGEGYKLIY